MKICYETVRNSEEIRTYITQADQSLLARGFTEHSFAHVTLAETAQALDIPPGTVSTRQRKALSLLKLHLTEEV